MQPHNNPLRLKHVACCKKTISYNKFAGFLDDVLTKIAYIKNNVMFILNIM